MDKETKKDLQFEIRARNIVLKRLKSPLEHARALGEKKKGERIARIEELSTYKTYEEAHEAYGWGYLNDEEFQEVVDFLEKNEEMKGVKSAEEYAAEIIGAFVAGLSKEIASIEFELLPPEEQERIRKKHEEFLERRIARKKMDGDLL